MGFLPYWDFKPTKTIQVDSPGVYTSENILDLSTKNKIHLKSDFIDGSIVDGLKQPVPFKFALDEASGFKVFCGPETIHYKKTNKSVFNSISFSL